jgi:hypothetical protein
MKERALEVGTNLIEKILMYFCFGHERESLGTNLTEDLNVTFVL